MTTETEGAEAPANALAPEPAPKEPAKEQEAPPQSAEPTGEAASEEVAKKGDKVEEIKKDIGRIKKRFDTLTAQRYAAEARATSAERQLTEMQQRYAQLQKINPDASLEEQDANRLRRVMLEDRSLYVRDERDAARREAVQTSRELIAARLEDAADRLPAGVMSKLETLPRFSEQTLDFIANSEKGADLAHFIAENPSEAGRLSSLSPYQQGVELARLEARVSVPQPRKATTAPPPPPRVTGSPGKAAKTPSELTPTEMKAQLIKAGVLRKR